MDVKEVESAIESILFAAGEPVGVERLCITLEIDRATADAVCQRLADQYSYERRGIRLVKLENCYQMCSAPEYANYIRKAFESRRPAKLSQSALEVLAVIAYYQPTTKAYVDQIRGVDSTYTVGLLTERDLIEECGRLTVPGRPILYRTTQTFLRSFGLSSLEELPDLPSASEEEEQLTLDMQAQVERLREQTDAPVQEQIGDEELEAAARALAQREGATEAGKR
ncbi:MAG: SMC-Scp complex subunit ScpB [Pseudoflavonifractor sp.]|nr:SMC-Scp complex subunit ScpB [Pseudoflavonifractor sp.]